MHNEDTEPMEQLKERFRTAQTVKVPVAPDVCELLNAIAQKRRVSLQVVVQKNPQVLRTFLLRWIKPYRGSMYQVTVHELPYDIYLLSPISFNVVL